MKIDFDNEDGLFCGIFHPKQYGHIQPNKWKYIGSKFIFKLVYQEDIEKFRFVPTYIFHPVDDIPRAFDSDNDWVLALKDIKLI